MDIQLRARQVFTSVLKYAYELLTLDSMMKVNNTGTVPVQIFNVSIQGSGFMATVYWDRFFNFMMI
jgi:hypothetical protein